jgi:hypothetical protein
VQAVAVAVADGTLTAQKQAVQVVVEQVDVPTQEQQELPIQVVEAVAQVTHSLTREHSHLVLEVQV